MGHIIRLIIIAIVIWLVVHLIRRAFFRRQPERQSNTKPIDPPRMLPCERCGVHIPENQALLLAGKAYCSTEHLPR